MNPAVVQKLAQEIGSLVVQCHSLQTELDLAQQKIADLVSQLAAKESQPE